MRILATNDALRPKSSDSRVIQSSNRMAAD